MNNVARQARDETTGREVVQLKGPRLPYHSAVEERFGVSKAEWMALVDAVFPSAKSAESVILALSYCAARKLDPMKKPVHIVPIWNREKRRYDETVWPGIGELRTTAFRTGLYAGRDATKYGEMITKKIGSGDAAVTITFPEWAQITVYRTVNGQRVAFEGPAVYWEETFSEAKGGAPNAMWRKRPHSQLDKCAEAAALRAAFPEEIGEDYTDDESGMIHQHSTGPTINGGELVPDERPRRSDYPDEEQEAKKAATLHPQDEEPPYPEHRFDLIDETGEVKFEALGPGFFVSDYCRQITRLTTSDAVETFIENNADAVRVITGEGLVEDGTALLAEAQEKARARVAPPEEPNEAEDGTSHPETDPRQHDLETASPMF